MFEQIKNVIERFDRILIHRHSRPDGDAMGSQIGLRELLRHNYPEKEVLAVGDSTGFFGFMEGAVMDEVADEAYENALAIVLDCGAEHLISDTRWKTAAATARMDHHIFTGQLAEFEVIDTSFESCCGMVAALAEESGWALTPLAAKSLYTGMVTDSGRFRYDGTTARTFKLASFLMEQEFDTNEIFRDLYADSFENKKLKAQYILKTQFTDKRVAYIYTSLDELKAMNISTFTASRAMVNTMADIKGTDIWANFTETENGILCELRSSRYNIQPIAVKHGGGGHAKACGCTAPDYNTVMEILHELDEMTGESK